MVAGSAVRMRRIHAIQVFAVFLLLFALLSGALYWSAFSAGTGVTVEYVGFESTDGVWIAGAVFSKKGMADPQPGVVVVHGLTSYKENMNRLSVELARHDFVVLAIDLRDHGSSSGQCTFGLPDAEPEDVVHALAFLRARPGVDPERMAIVGHSFGGMVALTAASKPTAQVNATVTWAAPTDLLKLEHENHEAVAFVADQRILPADILDPLQLTIRSPVTYISTLRPGSTLFMHGMQDTLVPPSQTEEALNRTGADGQVAEMLPGLGHSMDSPVVVERTISFIELKTRGRISEPIDPTYPAFTQARGAFLAMMALLNLPLTWLAWEFWCTHDPQPVRIYSFPAKARRALGAAFGAADVAVFAGLTVALATVVVSGGPAVLFAGVLPAPSLFTASALAGLGLVAAAFGLARVERRVRGRDGKRFEEGESLGKSVLVGVPALAMVPAMVGIQYVLVLGVNTPRSAAFLVAAGLLFVVMLGFEAFLRLRLQRRLRGVIDSLAPSRGLAHAAASIVVGGLLYFAMMAWVFFWLFAGFADALADAAALTLAVGLLTSLLYDRTKSIVPGAIFSGLYFAWVLNAAFHF